MSQTLPAQQLQLGTSSSSNPLPQPPKPPQPPAVVRPYRRFILPSLHRRFTNAALVSLALAAVQALWLGPFNSIWHVLAFSTIRTLLLFLSSLAIYVLRVANLHVGPRNTNSEFQSFLLHLLTLDTFRAFLWYTFSALFFCEIYIWSAPSDARLSIVDQGRSWERQRLNERPIFLRSLFLCLAAAQASTHLYLDYDRLPIPISKSQTSLDALKSQNQNIFWSSLHHLRQNLLSIVSRSFFRAFAATFTAPLVYWIFIRHTAWSWSFQAARLVFDLHKSSRAPSYPPLILDLLGRFLLEGFLLVFAWELANSAFDSFLAREPLKQAHPLTDESQDPNGSLINGLKTTRPVPGNFAFWELVLIAHHFEPRRLTIYNDISRNGGSTWSQILTICLGELHAIVKRIQMFEAPPGATVPQPAEQSLHSLPRISVPVKQDNILKTNPSARISHTTHAPSKADKLLSSSATKLLTYTAESSLAQEQKKYISKGGFLDSLHSLGKILLRFPIGIPFRQSFARRACAVAFSAPYGNIAVVADSITSLSKLTTYSVKEDKLGTVYRDVPNIIRTFTSTYSTIDAFVKRLDVHWTDIYFTEPKQVHDLEIVLTALKEGLKDIVNEFGEYSADLGLSATEMRQAKEIVAKGALLGK